MREAVAFWFEGAGRFSLVPETLAAVEPGTCAITTLFTGISPGTERLVYGEGVPEAAYQSMRCPYMEGAFPHPVKYGYSLVGYVTVGPDELIGRPAHILHPHQSGCVVRAEDIFPLPDEVPPRRATLASNLETAVTAVWDSGATLGDRIVVVGFGIVGSLIARLLSWIPGIDLWVSDREPAKQALASAMGFRTSAPEQLRAGFDLAFHASGTGAGLQLSIDHVAFEGHVIDVSWYGAQPVTLRLGETFHYERKSIVSSQVSHVPAARSARWDSARRKALVFSLLKRSEFDDHISRSFRLSDLPSGLLPWLDEPGPELAAIVEYAGAE